MFEKVDQKVSFPELEKQLMARWKEENTFQRSLELRAGKPRFVFYEGPPTANGKPATHHILARAFKDLFPRYKTMKGFYVERKAGWDTHGLPARPSSDFWKVPSSFHRAISCFSRSGKLTF